MNTNCLILGVAANIFLMSFACAQQASKLQTSTAVKQTSLVCAVPCITLIGTVKREKNYGPPGFGETPKIDRKVVDYILVLDHEINIEASKYVDAANGVGEVQLILPFDNNPLVKRVGRVRVTGTLAQAITAADVRDYTLTVTSLQFIR